MTIQQILDALEELAPCQTCEPWDNVGLLVGDPSASASRVLVALDMTDEVIEEAVEKEAQLIVSHHPLWMKPLASLRADTMAGRRVQTLIRAGIGAVCMHTNLDVAPGGVNDMLAAALGLQDVRPLQRALDGGWRKIRVFVPAEYAERVASAMFEAGAGHIAAYDQCSFQYEGQSAFRPLPGAKPFVGAIGQRTVGTEVCVETVTPAALMEQVRGAMLSAHPYEVPAYDIFDDYGIPSALALGRIGHLSEGMSLTDFVSYVSRSLNCKGVRSCGQRSLIRTVAVAGGSCAELAELAFHKGADVLVTADIKYHQFLDAGQQGWCLVDAGHFATEQVVCSRLKEYLSKRFPQADLLQSERMKDPISYYGGNEE